MIYNMSNITGALNIFEITKAVDAELFKGLLSLIVIIGIWVIIFNRNSEDNTVDAFTVACLITTVLATIGWWFAGLIHYMVILSLNAITFLAIVLQLLINRK